jgi:hypothetical protein
VARSLDGSAEIDGVADRELHGAPTSTNCYDNIVTESQRLWMTQWSNNLPSEEM